MKIRHVILFLSLTLGALSAFSQCPAGQQNQVAKWSFVYTQCFQDTVAVTYCSPNNIAFVDANKNLTYITDAELKARLNYLQAVDTLTKIATINYVNNLFSSFTPAVSPDKRTYYKYTSKYPHPISVWKDSGSTVYQTNFNWYQTDNSIVGDTVYIDPVNGVDSVTRGTVDKPLKTLSYTYNNRPTAKRYYLFPGVYDYYHGFKNINIERDISIKRYGSTGRVLITNRIYPTITKLGGYTYIYSFPYTGTAVTVVDTATKNYLGMFQPYYRVASLALTESTAGSYYTDGTTARFHRHNNASPDSSVFVMSNIPVIRSVGTSKVHLEDIDCWGGSEVVTCQNANTVTMKYVTSVNCRFLYAGGDGFGSQGNVFSAMNNCFAGYANDGIDYSSHSGFEYYCQSHFNTIKMNSTANSSASNGSTAHKYSKVLRVGGQYTNNGGPNVADINATVSVNIGCYAKKSYRADSPWLSGIDFEAGTITASTGLIDNIGVTSNIIDCSSDSSGVALLIRNANANISNFKKGANQWVIDTFSNTKVDSTFKSRPVTEVSSSNDVPYLANVATSGNYTDLINIPIVDTAYDVYLIIGQSNNLGRDTMASLANIPFSDSIKQLGRFNGNNFKIIPAVNPLDNVDATANSISPPNYFALKVLQEKNPLIYSGRKILLVPCARGGFGFRNEKWNPGNPSYDSAVMRVNWVLSQYPGSKLKVILWHQGEQDTNDDTSAMFYYRKLDRMMYQLRKDIKGDNEEVPYIVGGFVPKWVSQNPTVRTVVENSIKQLPSVTPFTGFSSSVGLVERYDTIHFNVQSLIYMGARYYNAYFDAIRNNTATTQVYNKVTSGSAIDVSGNGFNIPSFGIVNVYDDFKDSVIRFDSTTSYMNDSVYATYVNTMRSGSFSTWFRYNSSVKRMELLNAMSSSTGRYSSIYLDSGYVNYEFSGVSKFRVKSTKKYNDNKWHFLEVSKDDAGVKIFVDDTADWLRDTGEFISWFDSGSYYMYNFDKVYIGAKYLSPTSVTNVFGGLLKGITIKRQKFPLYEPKSTVTAPVSVNGTASSPGISFGTSGYGTGLYGNTTSIGVSVGGLQRLDISSSGTTVRGISTLTGNSFTVEDSAGTDGLSISNTGILRLGNTTATPTIFPAMSSTLDKTGSNLVFQTNSSAANRYTSGAFQFKALNTASHTANVSMFMSLSQSYAPTSGTGEFNYFVVSGIVNQTGGSNGIVRGVWINNTLTLAPNYRAIESNGDVYFNNATLNVGSLTKNSKAIANFTSTTQIILPTRMTAAQASALSLTTNEEGGFTYILDTNGTFTVKGWWGWNGASWERLNN